MGVEREKQEYVGRENKAKLKGGEEKKDRGERRKKKKPERKRKLRNRARFISEYKLSL